MSDFKPFVTGETYMFHLFLHLEYFIPLQKLFFLLRSTYFSKNKKRVNETINVLIYLVHILFLRNLE